MADNKHISLRIFLKRDGQILQVGLSCLFEVCFIYIEQYPRVEFYDNALAFAHDRGPGYRLFYLGCLLVHSMPDKGSGGAAYGTTNNGDQSSIAGRLGYKRPYKYARTR